MALRAILYVRVSSDRQAEKWSPAAQRRALAEHCQRQGWTVVATHEDLGISGATIAQRPGMLALLADVRRGAADVVLAVEQERFSRGSPRDWDEFLTACEEGGAKFGTPSQILDPRGADDGFLADLAAALSRRERRKIIERTIRGLRERAASGLWLSGRPPTGYTLGADGHLAIDEATAPVIRRIFDEVLAGRTFSEVAHRLNREGSRSENGAAWSAIRVSRIIRNRVYCGELGYRSATHRGRPAREGAFVVERAHEPIVSPARFAEVHAACVARARRHFPRSRRDGPYALSGLLLCRCGRRMHGGLSSIRLKTGRKSYPQYRCSSRVDAPGTQKCASVAGHFVEAAVLAEIARVFASPTVVDAVRRELVALRLREGTSEARRVSEMRDRLAESERRAAVLLEDRLAGRLTGPQFGEANAREVEAQEQLRREIVATESAMLQLRGAPDVESLVARLRDFPSVWRQIDPLERRLLLWDAMSTVRLVRSWRGGADVAIEWRLPGIGPAIPTLPPATADSAGTWVLQRRRGLG